MAASRPGIANGRILIVAREASLRARLAQVLKGAGHAVELADSVAHARRLRLKDIVLAVVRPDGLGPGAEGLMAELRVTMPTLLLTSTSVRSRSNVLDASDDATLLAQIAEALRPSDKPEPGPVLRFAEYILDIAAHSLMKNEGTEIPLTRGEFSLLQGFLHRPGRVLSRDHLLGVVAGRSADVYDRSVDMLVSRLRRKIEPDTRRPLLIKTVPGSGYKFTGKVERAEPVAASGDAGSSPQAKQASRALAATVPSLELLAGKPSLAVLPFDNLGGDLEQEVFADGLADDLITELSRNTSLLVISRHSSFSFRGRSSDVKDIARELRVRYVVEGSVRRVANRMRVNAKLIDAELGNNIWAERYDRAVEDVFAVQDEIALAVTNSINPIVDDAEQRRAVRKHPESLSAWEAYQRGRSHMGKFDAAENAQAKTFFQHSIALSAGFAPAYSALAVACHFEGSRFATRPLVEANKEARFWADKAVDIDPADADAQAVLANITLAAGDREGARERASLALENAHLSPWSMGLAAGVALNDGQSGQARHLLFTVMRRSPRDPLTSMFQRFIAMSYYYERDFIRAVEAAKRAVVIQPDNPMQYRWLAASLGQLGRTKEACEALRKAIGLSPKTFGIYVRERPPWFRPEDHELMLDGLCRAGWKG